MHTVSLAHRMGSRRSARWTALMWAAYNGRLDVVTFIVKASANVDAVNEDG